MELVYVTARLAVVFGIISASNVGGKIVIVRGTCYKLIQYLFCKEVWLVVLPVHMLWHEISEALATWLFLVADFSELRMLYLRMVTEYHVWKAFLVMYPTRRAVRCCHQGQVKQR